MKKILNFKYAILFLILGLGIFFYPYFFSDFNALAGDYIDSRYLNYILEHFWQFINQISPHQSLWDIPMYYPSKNTLATSDCLFGLGLIYVPLRFLFSNYTSFMLTIITLCILNFVSFYYLLKKYFQFNDISCAFGSFIFAFCLFRQEQLNHAQLLSQFLTIVGIIFFLKTNKNKVYSYIGTFFIALQLYTSFYLCWLLFLAIGLSVLILLCIKDYRKKLFYLIKNYYDILIGNLVFFIVLIAPLTYHYLQNDFLKFPFEVIKIMKPTLLNGILNNSFLDNFLFFHSTTYKSDTLYGIGLFTTLVLIYGITKLKKHRKFCISLIVIILAIMNCEFIQRFIYNYIIGGGSIRAYIRCYNIILPLFAIILADIIQNTKKNNIKYLIVTFVLLEQISMFPLFNWTKIGAENRINSYTVPKTCNVVFLNYNKITSNDKELDKYEIDGMWLALRNNIYTVHGYGASMQQRKYVKLQPECVLDIK